MNLARLDVVRETRDEERVDVAPFTVGRVRLIIEIVRIVRKVSHRRISRWNSRRRLVLTSNTAEFRFYCVLCVPSYSSGKYVYSETFSNKFRNFIDSFFNFCIKKMLELIMV